MCVCLVFASVCARASACVRACVRVCSPFFLLLFCPRAQRETASKRGWGWKEGGGVLGVKQREREREEEEDWGGGGLGFIPGKHDERERDFGAA
jgi:hypothetical protein